MRKFDPETQRSAPVDEARLLPLTETPVDGERCWRRCNARLSGGASSKARTMRGCSRTAIARGRRRRLSRMGVFRRRSGADGHAVRSVSARGSSWKSRRWSKPDRSLVEQGRAAARAREHRVADHAGGHLSAAGELQAQLASHPGLDLDQLGAVDVLDEDETLGEIEFTSRPTLRFHGSIPALIEQMRNLMKQDTRTLLAAPNQGEVERLANLLQRIRGAVSPGRRASSTPAARTCTTSPAIWPATCGRR